MLSCVLPWPPSALRPNRARRQHWGQNATAAALYKSLCAIEFREQGIGKVDCDRVSITLTFCPPRRGKMDRSGSLAAFKAGEDALADALGVDDDNFEPITLCRGPVVKGGEVRISIEESW